MFLVLVSCSVPATPRPPEPPSPTPLPTPSPTPPAPPPPTPPPPPTSPTPTVGLPEIINEVEQSTELITRDYKWQYGGRQWTWELRIPKSLYNYYQGRPRPPTPNYSVYVTHPLDDTFIEQLISEFERVAQKEGFSDLQKVELATSFVQSLPYTADSVTTSYDEYPRYPIETLVDYGGDCEDTSILTASLLSQLGYGVVLIIYPREHAAVGVLGGEGIYGTYFQHNEGKYFYLETTDTGWGIGIIPEEYKDATARILDMVPTPVLTHTWTATGSGSIVELEVTVQNLGSSPAYGVYILSGFDAGGDKLWNPEESEPFQVSENSQLTVKFSLQAPLGEHTRLVIQVVDGGYAVDESRSEWFDT